MKLIERANHQGLVIDGAMSDELERQGIDPGATHLWTAEALVNNLAKVYQAHVDYLQAGADIIITDIYQATTVGFKKAGYSEKEAENYIKAAVKIAKHARDDFEEKTGKHNYVAASIGSYGAFLDDGSEYTGAYHLTKKQFLAFHLPRLKAVLTEKPDLLAIETQPRLDEVLILLDWLKENAPQIPVYISFTLKNQSNPDHISNGTTIKEAIKKVEQYQQVFAMGINCIKPQAVSAALRNIRKYTKKPMVVYPNLGGVYNVAKQRWEPFKEKINLSELTKEWYELGAKLIGGCCSTLPKQIKVISQTLQNLVKNSRC